MKIRKGLQTFTACLVCRKLAITTTCDSCYATLYGDSDRDSDVDTNHKEIPWKVSEKMSFLRPVHDLKTRSEYFVATHNIKPGTVLLEEPACFYSPAWDFVGSTVESVKYSHDRLCISCGKICLSENQRVLSCSKCNWPVCSEQCQNDRLHLENDCKLFLDFGLTFPLKSELLTPEYYFSSSIAIARAIGFMHSDKTKYKALLRLQNTISSDDLENEFEANAMRDLFLVKSWLHGIPFRTDQIKKIFDSSLDCQEDFKHLSRTVRLKHFIINYDIEWGPPRSTIFMYLKASQFSHSCVPNCNWTIGPAPEYNIRVMSSVLINKDERLTVSLLRHQSLHDHPTFIRQKILKLRGIQCECKRCTDPTELGLFTSSTRCLTCKKLVRGPSEKNKGYYIPSCALNPKEMSWDCNGCGKKLLGYEISSLLAKSDAILSSLKDSFKKEEEEKDLGLDFHFLDEVATQVEQHGMILGLHPNYVALFQAIKSSVLVPMDMAKTYTGITLDVCLRRMNRLLYCIEIYNAICPGFSIERANLQFSLLTVIYSILSTSEWVDSMTEERIKQLYKLLRANSTMALKFFEKEFEHNQLPTRNANLIRMVLQSLNQLKIDCSTKDEMTNDKKNSN